MSTSSEGPDAPLWYFQPIFDCEISLYLLAFHYERPCNAILNDMGIQKNIAKLLQLILLLTLGPFSYQILASVTNDYKVLMSIVGLNYEDPCNDLKL